MHTFSKIFICAISMVSAGVVHAAAPADTPAIRKQLAADIQGDLKQLHDLLAKMLALPKDSLNEHLKNFTADSLNSFKHAIRECAFSTGFVHEEYSKLHPVGVCKAPNKQSKPAVQAQHKTVSELYRSSQATKPSVGAIAPQVPSEKPLGIMTHFEDGTTIGTATQNLMATSPKFKMGIEIGSLSKKLLGMTADKQRLGAHKPLARRITKPEDSTLRQFQNASEQKLEKFVDFLRALIDGSKPLTDFHLKFHVGSVVSNVGLAAQEMSEEQLKPLHALLTQLAQ